MTLKKTLALLLVLAALAGIMAGCGKGKNEEDPELPDYSQALPVQENYAKDEVFTLNFNREAGMNPISTKNNGNYLCTQLMYDNMFEVDSSFEVSSRIIYKSETPDNGATWLFYVDRNVSFWDGSKLTAQDVAYSVRRAQQSPRFKERLSVVLGVSAVDEEKVLISTYWADNLLPLVLTVPIIKNESMEDNPPMGTGPYKPNSILTKLDAFTGNGRTHPLDTIYLKEVIGVEATIAAFETSELDLVLNDPTSFTSLGYGTANDVRNYPTTNMHFVGFNSASRYFSNVMFRRAMNYLVNREEIVSTALRGQATAAELPMNPVCALYNSGYADMWSYSLSKGLEALDEAEVQDYDNDGYREIMVTGIPIEMELSFVVCSDSAQKVVAARVIRDGLEDMGIKVNLRELGRKEFLYALGEGSYDMYYSEIMLTADFDPSVLMLKNRSLNYGKFSLEGLETVIKDYLTSEPEDRQRTASLMFQAIVENAPIVTVCFERHQVISHRGVVVNMRPSQFNTFYNLDEWTIDFD